MKQILTYIAVFLIVNGLLWGAQEIYHYSDNQKLDAMETQIKSLDSKISSFEMSMNASGATKYAYDNYSKNIDERNSLVDEYSKLSKDTGSRWYLIPIPLGHSK